MSELHEHVVPRLHQREDLAEPAGSDEGIGPLPALRIVGYRHPGVEEPREHLAPAGPRLVVLVHNRGVAAEEDCGDATGRLYSDGRHGRGCTPYLYIKVSVPVEFAVLT